MLNIDSDVPFTGETRGRKKSQLTETVEALEVGQSVSAPLADWNADTARQAAFNTKKRYPERRFATRSNTDGVRIWRLE